MVAPDNDPSNVNQYEGFDDPTGTPTPRDTHGGVIGVRQIIQTDYDNLTDLEKAQDVLYVVPASE